MHRRVTGNVLKLNHLAIVCNRSTAVVANLNSVIGSVNIVPMAKI